MLQEIEAENSESRSSHEERGLKCLVTKRLIDSHRRSSHEERGLKYSPRLLLRTKKESLLA